MVDENAVAALHKAVNCYLATLAAVGDCVGGACPPVGGPYRHRISRLRARVAFDTQPEALQASVNEVSAELKQYSAKASGYLEAHGAELRRALHALEEIIRTLAGRQEFYSARLRRFAKQMEALEYPADPEHLKEAVTLQSSGLLNCLESMSHETQSLLIRMREEMRTVELRLEEAETTDPVTGFMNRREMERRLEQEKAAGAALTILRFELNGAVNDDVVQQVGVRLSTQFRHNDYIARWAFNEFLVLFRGPEEIATARVSHIVPWIAGRYPLDTGDVAEITVKGHVLHTESAQVQSL